MGLLYIHLFSEVLILRSPFASENKIRWVFKSPQLNFGYYSTVRFTADARLGFKLMTRLFSSGFRIVLSQQTTACLPITSFFNVLNVFN